MLQEFQAVGNSHCSPPQFIANNEFFVLPARECDSTPKLLLPTFE